MTDVYNINEDISISDRDKKLKIITQDNFFKDKPKKLVKNFRDVISPWVDNEGINEKSYNWKSLYNKPLKDIAPHNYLIMNPTNDKKSDIELSDLDQLDLDSQNFAERKLDNKEWFNVVNEHNTEMKKINDDFKKKLSDHDINIGSLTAKTLEKLSENSATLDTILAKLEYISPETSLVNKVLEPVTLFFLTASAEIYRDYLINPKLASEKIKSLRTFLDQASTLPGMKDDVRIKNVEKKIDDLGESLKII